MKRTENVFKKLGELYEFYQKIKKFTIPAKSKGQSGSRGFLAPSPHTHTTRQAGPHRAVPKDVLE